MSHAPSKDPLHGVTLETVLNHLVERYGWQEMGRRIEIRCFLFDPSVKSSLQFLRRTPWARAKVEAMFLESVARSAADADAGGPECETRTCWSRRSRNRGISSPTAARNSQIGRRPTPRALS